MEDAKDAWNRREEILKNYEAKRPCPEDYLVEMTQESGLVMATEEERRERYDYYRMEELQLLGAIQPGGGDLPEHEYEPTTPGDLTEQQPGEEEQREKGPKDQKKGISFTE